MADYLIVRVPRLRVQKGKTLEDATNPSFRRLRLGEQLEALGAAEGGWVEVKAKGFFLPIHGFVEEKCLAPITNYPHLGRERLAADFKRFASKLPDDKRNTLVDALVVGLPSAGIVTPRRIAHFMAQCAHESRNFTAREEGLSYSAEQIVNVFGGEIYKAGPLAGQQRWPKKTDPEALSFAKRYARKPRDLANYAYAWKNGNGSPESGDGYRYRGRGYIQLTGRGNYHAVGERIGIDLEADPDLLSKKADVAMLSACCFWALQDESRANADKTTLNEFADDTNVEKVTRPINSKAEGLASRELLFAKAQNIWSDDERVLVT